MKNNITGIGDKVYIERDGEYILAGMVYEARKGDVIIKVWLDNNVMSVGCMPFYNNKRKEK